MSFVDGCPSPIDGIPSHELEDQRGNVIRVTPVFYSGPNAPYPKSRALRWAVQLVSDRDLDDTKKRSWVGPPIGRDPSFDAVAREIAAWWDAGRPDD